MAIACPDRRLRDWRGYVRGVQAERRETGYQWGPKFLGLRIRHRTEWSTGNIRRVFLTDEDGIPENMVELDEYPPAYSSDPLHTEPVAEMTAIPPTFSYSFLQRSELGR
jgi:hypothetical protein